MPAPLNPVFERVAAAGESLGLSPFRLALVVCNPSGNALVPTTRGAFDG